jgi:aspartate racemase
MKFLQNVLQKEVSNSAKIGVYIGMGAEAGYHFQSIFNQKLGKKIKEMDIGDEKVHPQIFTISDPWLPRKDKGVLGTGNSPIDGLQKGIEKFNDFGVDFLLAPCNTLMFYKEDLQNNANFQIIDIVEETAKKSKNALSGNPDKGTVGILATGATIKSELYKKALEKQGIKSVILGEEESKLAEDLIEQVKSGDFHDPENESDMKDKMKECFTKLKQKGADAIILGCTEFPVIYDRFDQSEKPELPIISSSEALAEAGVEKFVELYKQRVIDRYSSSANSNSKSSAKAI